MEQPRESVANRAVLASFSVSYFRGRKRDLAASKSVWASTGSDPKRSNVTKHLLKDAVSPITSLYNQIYQYHQRVTAPWGEGNVRILKATAIMDYQAKMRDFKRQFWSLAENLFARYGEFIDAEAEHLGAMFRIEDYPAISEMKSRFNFTVDIDPLPAPGSDWRLDMSDDQMEKLRAEFEESTQRRLNEVLKENWQSLYGQLQSVADILGKGNKKAIKSTTFAAVGKLTALLTQLNITDDPNLERMRAELESLLCDSDPESKAETFRESKSERTETKDKLSKMMKEMEGWMS